MTSAGLAGASDRALHANPRGQATAKVDPCSLAALRLGYYTRDVGTDIVFDALCTLASKIHPHVAALFHEPMRRINEAFEEWASSRETIRNWPTRKQVAEGRAATPAPPLPPAVAWDQLIFAADRVLIESSPMYDAGAAFGNVFRKLDVLEERAAQKIHTSESKSQRGLSARWEYSRNKERVKRRVEVIRNTADGMIQRVCNDSLSEIRSRVQKALQHANLLGELYSAEEVERFSFTTKDELVALFKLFERRLAEHARSAAEPVWQFDDDGFYYLGDRFDLRGKPLKLLRLFTESRQPLAVVDIRYGAWGQDVAVQVTDDQVRELVWRLRKFLREKFGTSKNSLPAVAGAHPTRWRLDLSALRRQTD
jgi:hypothetical protein